MYFQTIELIKGNLFTAIALNQNDNQATGTIQSYFFIFSQLL
jgi:hypothetical protein